MILNYPFEVFMDPSFRSDTFRFIEEVGGDKQYFQELDQDLENRKKSYNKDKMPLNQIILYRFASNNRLIPIKSIADKETSQLGKAGSMVYSLVTAFANAMSWVGGQSNIDTGYFKGKSAVELCANRLRNQVEELETRSNALLKQLDNKELSYSDISEIFYLLNILGFAGGQIYNEVLTMTPLFDREVYGSDEVAAKAKEDAGALLKKLQENGVLVKSALHKMIGAEGYDAVEHGVANNISDCIDPDYDWSEGGDYLDKQKNQVDFIHNVVRYQVLEGVKSLVNQVVESEGFEVQKSPQVLAGKWDLIFSKSHAILEELTGDFQSFGKKTLKEPISSEDVEKIQKLIDRVVDLKKIHGEISMYLDRLQKQVASLELSEDMADYYALQKEQLEALAKQIDKGVKQFATSITGIETSAKKIIEAEPGLLKAKAEAEAQIAKFESRKDPIVASEEALQKEITSGLQKNSNLNKLIYSIPPAALKDTNDEKFLAMLGMLVHLSFSDKDAEAVQTDEAVQVLEQQLKEWEQWPMVQDQIIDTVDQEISTLEGSIQTCLSKLDKSKDEEEQRVIRTIMASFQTRQKKLMEMVAFGSLDIGMLIRDQTFLRCKPIAERLNHIVDYVKKDHSKISEGAYKNFTEVYGQAIPNAFALQAKIRTAPNFSERVQLEALAEQTGPFYDTLTDVNRRIFSVNRAKIITEALSKLTSAVG